MKNLYDHIAALAQRHPDKVALLICDPQGNSQKEITYRELRERVESAAAYLTSLGLRRGDRAALALGNSVEQLIVSWAAWSMGVVTVPLNTMSDTKALTGYKLKLTGAKQILHELKTVPPVPTAWMLGTAHEALILFTSGTTAHPKGAKLTLQNLVTNAEGIREWLQVGEGDRFLVLLPLHHINSTTFCLTTLLAGGASIIPPAYSNSGFWLACAKTGATFTSIVQSIVFDQLAREAEFEGAKSTLKLTRIQIGSAPGVSTTVEEFTDRFGIPLYQGYGQTETALRVTGVPMDLPPALYRQMVAENSIGTPMPWAEVEVADDEGRVLGEGEEGELIVKGKAVMSGYFGEEEAFRNGYFLTGDIGKYRIIDGQRFFYLLGRKKEIIIKGGVNISPVVVENSLKKISPDIAQAYVVGMDDKRYGEVPASVICFKRGVDETAAMRQLKLRLLFGSEHLSAYETPAYLTLLKASELPLTSTGKVQRVLLKRQLSPERFEPLHDLLKTLRHRFVIIEPHSPLAQMSLTLYNHCWQPLTQDQKAYQKYLTANLTLAAVDREGKIAGQISFKKEDGALVCISICSARYTPKPVPEVSKIPSANEVREYVLAGKDPVINFHLKLGAQVIAVNPDGRPEDKSALGYTVRMRYEVPLDYARGKPAIDESAPMSNQLIQAVLMFARDLGLVHVEALSRPGGLAAYLAAESDG